MDNNADYECYLLGCRSAGLAPLEKWRFRMLQEEFLRRAADPEPAPEHGGIPPFVQEPVVAGGAARPLPTSDAPDQSFWRV